MFSMTYYKALDIVFLQVAPDDKDNKNLANTDSRILINTTLN